MNQAKEQKNFYSFFLLQDVRGLERLSTYVFSSSDFPRQKEECQCKPFFFFFLVFLLPIFGQLFRPSTCSVGDPLSLLFLARKNWKSLKGCVAQFSFLVVSASRDGPEWIFMQSLGGGGRRLINGKNGEGRSICIRAGGECIPFSCKAPI